jgi:hypothetical protein
MLNYLIGIIHSQNGIQRDCTAYASKAYIEGLWVRFYEGHPKKIGGCKLTNFGTNTIIRSLFSLPQSTGGIYLYSGMNPPDSIAGSVSYIEISMGGISSGGVDRTPLSWTPTPNIIWKFDSGNFTGTDVSDLEVVSTLIFANPIQEDISNTTLYPVFAGNVNDELPLVPLSYSADTGGGPVEASGGILVCPPVLVVLQGGSISWSRFDGGLGINDPSVWLKTNTLPISNTKLVRGINILGGGSPTILLWSLNALYRASFVANPITEGPEPLTFISTTIHPNISIISANSVVTYDQMVFWIGIDQFYVYNGIVQSLPNTMNNDWFFESVNQSALSRIWGVAIPRYKEIWWFYPRDTATECNAVIIYNVEQNIFYDNTIPSRLPAAVYPFTRSAGIGATGNYPFPIYADNTLVANPNNPLSKTYPIWTHEQGVDRVIQNQTFAIPSYYTTHWMDLWSQDGTNSNLLINRRIAPDFQQIGSMTVTVSSLMYPNSVPMVDGPYPFTQSTEFIDLSSQGGLCNFTFESNTIGGDYFAGKSLYFYSKGDTLK